MKKGSTKIIVILLGVVILFSAGFGTSYINDLGATQRSLTQWKASTTPDAIFPRVESKDVGLWIKGSAQCLEVDADGVIAGTGSACGSGGGGGGTSKWATTTADSGIHPNVGADVDVLIGSTSTSTTAKLEVIGGIFANASSTIDSNFTVTGAVVFDTALTVANGGTGAVTLTGILEGNGTGAFTANDSSTVGQVLRVTGASAFAFGALDLADSDAITGTLPTGNGGTGVTTLDDIVGTANEITVTNGANTIIGGDATLSLPSVVFLGTSGQLGRDADNLIDFVTDNEIMFRTSATDNRFIIKSDGRVGVGSTTPMSLLGVNGTTTTETLNIDDPDHTGTSTIYIYSGTAGFGGEIILEDEDAAGCTSITTLNGTINGQTVTCPDDPIAN